MTDFGLGFLCGYLVGFSTPLALVLLMLGLASYKAYRKKEM